MSNTDYSILIDEIEKRDLLVKNYMFSEENGVQFPYKHLEKAVYSYLKAGGKSLRPAVLMFCCGAAGGDELNSLPAAAAIELYHTFTLVHDDIIDRDTLRRNVPTVHTQFANEAKTELGFDDDTAAHYGLAIAILAGDMQQGWAAATLASLHKTNEVSPMLVINLIEELFRRVQSILVKGETLDVVMAETPLDKVTEKEILEMLWGKTGILYEFAGRAGMAIGMNNPDLNHSEIQAIADFTGQCGTAFQIQDDILGIVGDQAQLGKPVGSDIREGKRTLILKHSFEKMTLAQKKFTLSVVGNQQADLESIQEVTELLRKTGGIDYAKDVAQKYVNQVISNLDILPASKNKTLLERWARYIIDRDF